MQRLELLTEYKQVLSFVEPIYPSCLRILQALHFLNLLDIFLYLVTELYFVLSLEVAIIFLPDVMTSLHEIKDNLCFVLFVILSWLEEYLAFAKAARDCINVV